MRIYACYDGPAESFMQPIFSHNNATAIRAFKKAANDQNSMIAQNPEDYTLFCIGEFDETSGEITPLPVFEKLGMALQYVDSQPPVSLVPSHSGNGVSLETRKDVE